MSFGFSVGDIIGAANLTYHLIKALHGSQDAGDEYRAAINELGCMQQAFMRVSCLGANPNISQATFESATCIVMGSMDTIKSFLEKTKKYDRRLGGSLGVSGLALNLRKVGWTMFKADDMKKLRESLQSRLAALSILLIAANLEPDGAGKVATFMEGEEQHLSPDMQSRIDSLRPKQQEAQCTQESTALVTKSIPTPASRSVDVKTGSKATDCVRLVDAAASSLTVFSSKELLSTITDPVFRSEKIKEVSQLLRTLVLMGDCQLAPSDRSELITQLDTICGSISTESAFEQPKQHLKFKDAVGRKFTFPWDMCKSWKDMEALIKLAFAHVDYIGSHVNDGHYDILGPDGEIILPLVWDSTIQPDWAVTMHMWPMSPPPETLPLPPPPPTAEELSLLPLSPSEEFLLQSPSLEEVFLSSPPMEG